MSTSGGPITNNCTLSGITLPDSSPSLSTANLNFNPTVVFDGNSSLHGSTLLNNWTDCIAVGKIENTSNAGNAKKTETIISNSTVSSGGADYFFHTEQNDLIIYGSANPVGYYLAPISRLSSSVSDTPSSNTIDYVLSDGNIASQYLAVVNGTVLDNSGTNLSTFSDYPVIGGRLNCCGGYKMYLGAEIAEIILFNAGPNSAMNDRGMVQSYLVIKYGITLGTTSAPVNYYNNSGTSTSTGIVWPSDNTYQNNIGGIALDKNGALNQKQSSSISPNTNRQLMVGLGSISSSNKLNSNTFNRDQTFLIWCDNGNTQSLATSSSSLSNYGTQSIRINCVWKLVNNGLSQVVQIQFPVASVANPSNCARYMLITASDAGFTTNVQGYDLDTLNSTTLSCSIIPPSGTRYFTYVEIGGIADGTAFLPQTKVTNNNVPSCNTNSNWKYYYFNDPKLTNGKNKKLFAIDWADAGGVEGSLIQGIVSYSSKPYANNSSGFTCNIMGRLIQISSPGASFGSGISVRIYYDSSELNQALVMTPSYTRSGWFKHPDDSASTVNDNNGGGVFNAIYPSITTGTEDSVYYAQYSGITGFSTFGFQANNYPISAPLPVTLGSFSIKVINCIVIAN